MRYLKAEDVKARLDTLTGDTWLCAMFQWRAGLRISEALDLRSADVDFEANTLTVRNGKGGKTRTVPLHPELRVALRSTMRPSGGKPYVAADRSTIYRRYQRFAGLPDTHCLRHSAARHWLNEGVTVNEVQLLLGHSDLATTMRYLRLVDPSPGALEQVS